MKFKIKDKVKTGYGIGKIVKIKFIGKNPIYLIKYSLIKKLWAFEDSIEKSDKDDI